MAESHFWTANYNIWRFRFNRLGKHMSKKWFFSPILQWLKSSSHLHRNMRAIEPQKLLFKSIGQGLGSYSMTAISPKIYRARFWNMQTGYATYFQLQGSMAIWLSCCGIRAWRNTSQSLLTFDQPWFAFIYRSHLEQGKKLKRRSKIGPFVGMESAARLTGVYISESESVRVIRRAGFTNISNGMLQRASSLVDSFARQHEAKVAKGDKFESIYYILVQYMSLLPL